MKIDDQRLAEIEAREKAATKGPWEATYEGSLRCKGKFGGVCPVALIGDNIVFIAAARTDVPDLIDDRRELTETIDEMNDPESVGSPTWLAKRMEQRACNAEAENAVLRAMLKRLEWAGYNDRTCPVCDGWKTDEINHRPDCELVALLKGGE